MPTVESLLEELYALEPELKKREKELRAALAEMIAAKPEIKISPAFVARLRAELLEKAAAPQPSFSFSIISFFKEHSHASAGVAGFAVAAAAVAVFVMSDAARPLSPAADFSAFQTERANSVATLAPGAFGPLAADQASSVAPSAISARPGSGFGGGMGVAGKMAAQPYRPIRLNYVVENPEAVAALLSPQGNVYKRHKPAAPAIGNDAKKAFAPFMNAAAFAPGSVTSFSVSGDGDRSYAASVNYQDGTASIFARWDKWPQDNGARMSASDLPSDAEAIAMADAFVARVGISRAGYAAPVVQKNWQRDYAAMANKDEFYFPEVIFVVYPLLVDGRPAYDQSGFPQGMQVGINARNRAVQSVDGIVVPEFDASSYALETDAKRIVSLATNGGAAMPYYEDGAVQIDIKLGAPAMVMAKTYVPRVAVPGTGGFATGAGEGEALELYVPSLSFPVVSRDVPAGTWTPEAIVIPLAKEILDASYGTPNGPITIQPFPMPRAEPAMPAEPPTVSSPSSQR